MYQLILDCFDDEEEFNFCDGNFKTYEEAKQRGIDAVRNNYYINSYHIIYGTWCC